MKTHVLKSGFPNSVRATFENKKNHSNQIWIGLCTTGHYWFKAAHIQSSEPAITLLCQFKACDKFSFPLLISKADSF